MVLDRWPEEVRRPRAGEMPPIMRACHRAVLLTLCLLACHLAFAQAQPPPTLDVYISTGDHHWMASSLPVDSPASIAASFDMLKAVGVRRIYWRGLQEAQMQATAHVREDNFHYATWMEWSRHLIEDLDIERLAVEAAHERGMELWGVGTLGDWGCTADTPGYGDYPWFWESTLRIEHPEWVPVDKYGYRKQGGPIELAYPEARQALVDLNARLAEHAGYDGVLFITYVENFSMRFQDEFAFNEPIVTDFKRKHGIDPRIDPFTKNACRIDFQRHRGTYLTEYLRELKSALPAGTGLGMFVNPRTPRFPQVWSTLPQDFHTLGEVYFDLESWVSEGIVDQLSVYGAYNGIGQPKTIADMLWLTRETGTSVAFTTSSPTASIYEPFHERTAAVFAVAQDSHYLTRGGFPEQDATALTSGTPVQRMRFLAQVAEGSSEAEPAAIVPLVEDANPLVRRLTIAALVKLGDPVALPAIEGALGDAENCVRCMAMHALGTLNRPESFEPMIAALAEYPEHPLHEAARVSLARVRLAPREELHAAAGHEDDAVRTAALRALRLSSPGEDDVPLLVEHLTDPHRRAAYSAAEALGSVSNSEAAVRALIEATTLPDAAVADRAATSLAAMVRRGDREANVLRPEVLVAARALFAQFGEGCARADAEWGYRPAGELLLALGDEGEAALREFMVPPAGGTDRLLAELAWRVLYFREKAGPNEFRFISEEESDRAFQVRPAWLPRLRTARFSEAFDDPGRYPIDLAGMAGDARRSYGRWGAFGPGGGVIDAEVAHSGTQSVRFTPGGRALVGATLREIADGRDWEAELWLRREEGASLLLAMKGRTPSVASEAELSVDATGAVLLRAMPAGEWLDSGLRVEPGTWTRLRLIGRRAFGDCYATVTPEGGEERASDVYAPTDVRSDLYVLALTGLGTCALNVDDVALIEHL